MLFGKSHFLYALKSAHVIAFFISDCNVAHENRLALHIMPNLYRVSEAISEIIKDLSNNSFNLRRMAAEHFSSNGSLRSLEKLFSIIEMVSATCYSCVVQNQPVPLEEYRPYLHRAIDGILLAFRTDNA